MNVYPDTHADAKSPQSPTTPPCTEMSVGSYGSNPVTSCGAENVFPQSEETL